MIEVYKFIPSIGSFSLLTGEPVVRDPGVLKRAGFVAAGVRVCPASDPVPLASVAVSPIGVHLKKAEGVISGYPKNTLVIISL